MHYSQPQVLEDQIPPADLESSPPAAVDATDQFLHEFSRLMDRFGDGTRARKVTRSVSSGSVADASSEKKPSLSVLVTHPSIVLVRELVEEAFSLVPQDERPEAPIASGAYARTCSILGPLTVNVAKNCILGVASYMDRSAATDEYLRDMTTRLVDPVLEDAQLLAVSENPTPTWIEFQRQVGAMCELWLWSFFPYVHMAWKGGVFNDCLLLSPHAKSVDRSEAEIAADNERWRKEQAHAVLLWSRKVDLRCDTSTVVSRLWLDKWLLYSLSSELAEGPGPILASAVLRIDKSGTIALRDDVAAIPDHVFLVLWKLFGGSRVAVNMTAHGRLEIDHSLRQLNDLARDEEWNIMLNAMPTEATNRRADDQRDQDDDQQESHRSAVCVKVSAPFGIVEEDLMIRTALVLQERVPSASFAGGDQERTKWIDELMLVRNIYTANNDNGDDLLKRQWEYRPPAKPISSYYWSTSQSVTHRGVCGLQNLGNTCYMNSALQVLSNSPLFRHALLALPLSGVLPSDTYRVTAAIGGVFRDMWYGGETSVSPSALKHEMGMRVSRFSGYEQHDSIDFLHCLLDKMHQELNNVVKKNYRERKDEDAAIPHAELSRLFWDDFRLNDKSLVTDIFYGQYRSLIRCSKCDNVSVAYESEMNLSVPLNKKALINLSIVLNELTLTDDLPFRRTAARIQVPTDATVGDVADEIKKLLHLPEASSLLLTDYQRSTTFCRSSDSIGSYVRAYYAHTRVPLDCAVAVGAVDDERPAQAEENTLVSEEVAQVEVTVTFQGDESRYNPSEFFAVVAVPLTWKEGQLVAYLEDLSKKVLKRNDEAARILLYNGGQAAQRSSERRMSRSYVAQFNDVDVKDLTTETSHPSSLTVVPPSGLKLEDCLRDMNETHRLVGDDQWYCGKCKQHQDAEINFMIHRVPPVLLVHLKRFKHTGSMYGTSKIDTLVDFPLYFDISRFVARDKDEDDEGPREAMWYALRGVIYHSGSLEGGHYTATAFAEATQSWTSFNDSHASSQGGGGPEARGAYILLYERINSVADLPPGPYEVPQEGESQSKKAKHE